MKEIELDIALTAGYLLGMNKIEVLDSRELINDQIPELAKEFYELHKLHENPVLEDYIGKIDEFAEAKLLDLYGSELD